MGAPAGYGQAVPSEVCPAQDGHSNFAITRHDGIMDAKDTLCQVAMLSSRSEDMLAYYTANEFATGFKKRPASQLRGIKQNKGSSCKGIWITKRQPGSSCPSPDVMAFVGSKDMLCRVAILYRGWEDTLTQFTIEESATGFKKSLAFQPRSIKQSKISSRERI